jgi:hypothetical protein
VLCSLLAVDEDRRVRYTGITEIAARVHRTRKGIVVSNHDGSYMLRDVLQLLTDAGVWEHLPSVDSQQLVVGIVDLACRHYDCNAGEILDGHEAFGICYSCRKPVEHLMRGLCPTCTAIAYGVAQ